MLNLPKSEKRNLVKAEKQKGGAKWNSWIRAKVNIHVFMIKDSQLCWCLPLQLNGYQAVWVMICSCLPWYLNIVSDGYVNKPLLLCLVLFSSFCQPQHYHVSPGSQPFTGPFIPNCSFCSRFVFLSIAFVKLTNEFNQEITKNLPITLQTLQI